MSRHHYERLASRANTPVADIKPPAGPEPGKVCAACKAEGHTVRRCIWTDIKGVIPACPFCESYHDHLPEDCPRYGNSILEEEIWQLFVVNCGGKSAYITKDAYLWWPNIILWRLEALPNEKPLALYPQSPGFARHRMLDSTAEHLRHNYLHELANPVSDPRTNDRDGIMKDMAPTDMVRPREEEEGIYDDNEDNATKLCLS